ncbi:MAG: ABC transporter ATP-binding protein [Candidatus Brocadiae bacterium]|nr:ABC transporter ATP-binding protein [Candidatus Brocadiia bacterium]
MVVLHVDALRKEFSSLVALDDVSFKVDAGHVVGLIGPNGAGKTTLLKILATLLPPTDGTATICGVDLKKNPVIIREHIGYLPDFFNLYPDLTLRECLDFFARAYYVPAHQISERVDMALAMVGLQEKQDSFVRNLSRGMIQRLGLGTLLVRTAKVFLLDEPASGLDPMARIQLRDILRQLARDGKSILISSHILTELAGFCTHLAIMNHGKLLMYGSVEEIEKKIMGQQSFIVKFLYGHDQAKAILEKMESVEILSSSEDAFQLACTGGQENIAEINRRLVVAGVPVIELSKIKTSFEDLFMTLSVKQNLDICE